MKILDVGGARKTFKDATHILDARPKPDGCKAEYTQQDACSKWPYKDKEFDYIHCSNLLEDVKDPVAVCKEMMRVGKAGRVKVPSPYLECVKGVDAWPKNEEYAGYYHHRWICIKTERGLRFMAKTPIASIYDWTSHLKDQQKLFIEFEWEGGFEVEELIVPNWQIMYNTLKEEFGIDPEVEL